MGVGLVGLLTAGLVVYAMYLDRVVARHFAGRLWPEPARVYASPLELYGGARLQAEDLARTLDRLGYETTETEDRPGTYRVDGDRVRVVTRGFRFWDGNDPSRAIEVWFDDDRVTSVRDAATYRDSPIVRLDPLLIGSIFPESGEDRLVLPLEEFPPLLVEAVRAVEDRRFEEHHGIDYRGIARAAVTNARSRDIVEGGSTLTQQLVKSRIVGSRRSIPRKLNEMIMALSLERRWTKPAILHAYLNEIYLGQDGSRAIHGFGLASYFYFDTPVRELDVPEIALLVAMVKGPSLYDPRRNPVAARGRRDVVLDVLVASDVISPEVAEVAKQQPIAVSARPPRGTTSYPAFMDIVRQQLLSDYPDEVIRSDGLRIFTTLSPEIQARAEAALSDGLSELEATRGLPTGSLEGAVVVTGVDGAEVQAVVGGREARYEGFNRALRAARPVGSLIKPAVYLRALESGRYTWASAILDTALRVEVPNREDWSPQNFDEQFRGRVSMFEALMYSYNVPTVRVGLDVGVESVVETLKDLGLTRELDPYPALLLGAVELSPFEMAQVYNTLAAGGFRTRLNAVREVTQSDGTPSRRYPLEIRQAVDPAAVYLVDRVLVRTTHDGTARSLRHLLPDDLEVAGKTGTSDGYRDSWFAGFSGDCVAVVWIGRDDNTPIGLTGATGALRVWGRVVGDTAARSFAAVPPPGVEDVWIDAESGLRSGEDCEGAVRLPFLADTAPTESADCGGKGFGRKAVDWVRDIFR